MSGPPGCLAEVALRTRSRTTAAVRPVMGPIAAASLDGFVFDPGAAGVAALGYPAGFVTVRTVLMLVFAAGCATLGAYLLKGGGAPVDPPSAHGVARAPATPRLPPADSAAPTRANRPAEPEPAAPAAPSLANPGPVAEPRYIVVGGGATPEYTEVSLEQDAELATRALPGPGLVLFAGGQGSVSVRLVDPAAQDTRGPSLLARLGEIFDPRAARDSDYRPTRLKAQAASFGNFETSLALALGAGDAPLLVYIATHGLQGNEPRDNFVELWGGDTISVAQLDELTASAKRPLRFVIASCYSGGFAELAFAHADARRGATALQRCGLFAGTWDRQTSGCDPNPDRRAQQGYSLHLLHALRGEDRAGKPLPDDALDFDGDGTISLLEAHTRARIASHSIDVPTTTSERYLREVVKAGATPRWSLLPEEEALVKQLGQRLGLNDLAAVERRYRRLSAELDALQPQFDLAQDELEQLRAQLGAQLLARWPVLGDPYHDQFAPTLRRDAEPIREALDGSLLARRYRAARAQADAIAARAASLDADEASVLRLLRAYETAGLASALAARGGDALRHYQSLLACERAVP